MRMSLRAFAVLLLGLLLLLPASAREEIRQFNADVVLATDGTVTVTETIVVNAEGLEIRRGIYRDIPVVMAGRDGGKVRPELDVLSVQRDGGDEPFRVERMGNFQRIWIGSPDAFVSRGSHRYVIRYTMTRMARSFEDHDELYWNATGNYWIFPILQASANVTLPDGAVISNLAGYTGAVGSTEQAVSSKRVSDTKASFRASRVLGAGEGMTIAVAFNKGVIAFPTGLAALQQRLGDLREVVLPLLAALIAIAYNALAWFRVGRDPARGTIIPLFHPPKDFSPALVHYVDKWGMFGNGGWTAFTATIFDLGVKGLVVIDNLDGKLRIEATGKQPEEKLPTGEQKLFDYFAEKGSVTVGKDNGVELAKKRAQLTTSIARENRTLWFRNNLAYSLFGIFLAAFLLIVMVAMDLLTIDWLIGAVVIGIIGGIAVGAIGSMRHGLKFLSFFGVFWAGVVLFNIGSILLETFSAAEVNTGAIAAISIVIVTIVFAALMRAPTLQGRKVMDQIDGLRMYIETAEKERMNMAGVPPMTVSRFERMLPFAIALGVEKPWSEHFEAELARHAVADANLSYQPNFYRGGSIGSVGSSASSITNAVSAAAASMTAAMVAAQPVQASSSGFSSGGGGGGGGSSGGGGGGGGGGGW